MYPSAENSPVPGLSRPAFKAVAPGAESPDDADANASALREALRAATEAGEWATVAELARLLSGRS